MMRAQVHVTIVAALAVGACGGSVAELEVATGDPNRWTVGPELVECEGVVVQDCMLVRSETDLHWQLEYDPIEGFTFEEGVTSIIDVEQTDIENPPADGPSVRTELVQVVEQTDGFDPPPERWLIGPDVVTCHQEGTSVEYRLARRETGVWDQLSGPIAGFEPDAGNRHDLYIAYPPGGEPELVELTSVRAVEPVTVDGTATWEVVPRSSFFCALEPGADPTPIVMVRTAPDTEPRLLPAPTSFEPDYFTAYEIEVTEAADGGFELVEILDSQET